MRQPVLRHALVLAVALAGCTREEARWAEALSDSSGVQGILAGRGGSRPPFLRRIDADILGVFREEIIPGSTQTVVATGVGSGADQCSILVFDDDGRIQMRYRVAGDTPVGYRLLAPGHADMRPRPWSGRRWICLTTGGMWEPYSIEVLEVQPPRGVDGLVPRLRIWVDGSPHAPVAGDGLLAFRSLANSFRDDGHDEEYPVAVCVVSMDEALSAAESDTVRDVVVPTRRPRGAAEDAGRGYLRYFLLRGELSRAETEVPLELTIADGVVRAVRQDGLTYVLHPATGAFDVVANAAFERLYAKRQETSRTPRPLPDYLGDLRNGVRSIAPTDR